MSARDEILTAVRHYLRREDQATPPPAPPPVPVLGRVDLSIEARVAQFAQRLEAIGGHCHRGDATAAITAILAQHRPHAIATSDADAVTELQRDAELARLPWLPPDVALSELFTADVGVTAVQWAIAETGTLVLESASERNRLASLLPPVHIALLPISRVLCTMGELLKTLGRPLSPAVTLISGPSRTADIELQLVLGVHGPRELHVVLV